MAMLLDGGSPTFGTPTSGTYNDPAQSPYSPGTAPLPPGSSTPFGPAPDPNAPGGGSGAGDGAGGGGNLPTNDWASAFFASLGLPPDVVTKVNQLFTQYSDVNAASAAALAYIRGTPWYAQTYPGIQEGINKGLISNEADYRNLLNQQSQIYKQYLGRDISSSEFASNLGEGVNLQTIGGRLQGAALAGTYGNDWQYKLGAFGEGGPASPDQLKALGEEQAGLDTPLGQQMKRRLDLAGQRLSSVFNGSLASANLSLINGRLAAPGLGGGDRPDVAA